MRVMQLIDSLELGGAERVAVNYANMLSSEIKGSYLCVTRKEGSLLDKLNPQVSYYFIKKKRTLDYKAASRTVKYIKKEKINIIHAHGTSFLFALLVKLKYKKVKIIWHNHHGASLEYNFFKKNLIKKCSLFFNAIIVVNTTLKNWTQTQLKFPKSKCFYISNFVVFKPNTPKSTIQLPGVQSERIVYLANLKHPKEHFFLIKAFSKLTHSYPNATLHLIGKDFQDKYSSILKKFLIQEKLEANVYIHGQQSDPSLYLNACSIGVISSSSEGLPMALLEYGRARLAPIVTDVGQCADVVLDKGLITPSGNSKKMTTALETLISNQEKKKHLGNAFFKHVQSHYSQEAIKKEILTVYSQI